MTILVVTSDFSWPPVEGLHQQTAELVRELAEHGEDVRLMGFSRWKHAMDPGAAASALGVRIDLVGVPPKVPQLILACALRLGALRIFPGGAAARLRKQLWDAERGTLHFDGLAASCAYRPKMAKAAVLSLIDPGSRRRMRLAQTTDRRVRKIGSLAAAFVHFRLERSLCHKRVVWHVVSEPDALWLQRKHHHHTVAIPVLNPSLTTTGTRPRPFDAQLTSDSKRSVVVFADLRQPHMQRAFRALIENLVNYSFVTTHVRVLILGRVSSVTDLTPHSANLEMHFEPWVDDYAAFLQSADAILLPDDVGTGLKNRAVQSLASGTPVIGTPVAFEGMPVVHNVHALVTAPREVTRSFSALLEQTFIDTETARSRAAAGRQMALRLYGATPIITRWLAIYSSLDGTLKDGDPVPLTGSSQMTV